MKVATDVSPNTPILVNPHYVSEPFPSNEGRY
jgi:hypothetical protein